jgi:hypothetical protein
MSDATKQLAAKVRNLFSIGTFVKRAGDGKVQATTLSNRTLEKREAFPYGFIAKAKSGRVFVLCQGGDFNGYEILPLLAADDIELPELDEEDAALYAVGKGNVKLLCKDGLFYIGNAKKDICALLLELVDQIKGIATAGSPAAHTVSPAAQQQLESFKEQIKKLFAEVR